MSPILTIFEPTIFETDMSKFPCIAANMLTINSGREVPKATIVNPTIIVETPSFLAKEEEPSISYDAPFVSSINPATKITIDKKIAIYLTSTVYSK